MRYQGKIANWKDDQGFGFVTPNGGGKKAFVHIKAFSSGSSRPNEGDLITYELATDENGWFRAETIRFVRQQAISTAPGKQWSSGTVFAILFCSILAVAVFTGRLPFAILGLYFAGGMLAFLAYAIDKSAAQNNRWRIRERTLHVFGMVGGWPGALLAQKMFRHKSTKKEFQTGFWATVVFNCFALGWFLTANGATFLRNILGSSA